MLVYQNGAAENIAPILIVLPECRRGSFSSQNLKVLSGGIKILDAYQGIGQAVWKK